jgi:hypothetical protein
MRWLLVTIAIVAGLVGAWRLGFGYAKNRLRGLASQVELPAAQSLRVARARLASLDSARLIEERFPSAPAYSTRTALLRASLDAVETDGLFCEFGVASGATTNAMAEHRPAVVFHGFDSFEGLPEDWRTGFAKGAFAMNGLPLVRSNVRLYKGWFDQTLPAFLNANPGPVAFLHMDADLYSSTKTVFDALGDRLRPGTVIQFDEYFNYPGWRRGEFQAFEELVEEYGIEYEVIGYCDGPMTFEQAAFRINKIGGRLGASSPGDEAPPRQQHARPNQHDAGE